MLIPKDYWRSLRIAILMLPLPFAAHGQEPLQQPAVDGLNYKLSGEGGSINDGEGGGLFQGSVTTPLGYSTGFQVDGALGDFGGETLSGVGAHLFQRDPSQYLYGVYASFHSWDSIDIARLGFEAEFYIGDITFSGVAGWESVDLPSTRNGLAVVNGDSDHFFTEFDVSWYLTENTRLTGGYHYESEQSFGVAEIEHMTPWSGAPTSLFARGQFGEDNSQFVAGLRLFFGRDPNKSLIRRHREDDPVPYIPVFPTIVTTSTGGGGGGFCPIDEVVEAGSCTCPDGSIFREIKESSSGRCILREPDIDDL